MRENHDLGGTPNDEPRIRKAHLQTILKAPHITKGQN